MPFEGRALVGLDDPTHKIVAHDVGMAEANMANVAGSESGA